MRAWDLSGRELVVRTHDGIMPGRYLRIPRGWWTSREPKELTGKSRAQD
jgi:hypothetical protein